MLLTGALFFSAAPATAAAPKVSVSVEPLEARRIVYMMLAPEKAGGDQHGQFSLRLLLNNKETKQVRMNKVTASFTGPPTVAMATISADHRVDAGATSTWSHLPQGNVILPIPAPRSVTLSMYFDGFTDPVTLTHSLAPHKSPVAGGAYLFPAKVKDLRFNEYWTARSGHATGNEGSQLFGYDMGVISYDEGRKAWTDLLPGTTGANNKDYRIWGKPIYAMADGTVLEAVNNVPGNPQPMKFRNEAEAKQQAKAQEDNIWGKDRGGKDRYPHGGSGNHFYIQHGDEVVLYAHMQTGTLNFKLHAAGAKVKAGDYLGVAGNSGSSSAPHLHIHAVQGTAPEVGPLRPLPFRNVRMVARRVPFSREPTGPWVTVTGAGPPNVDTNIWPENTNPSWYPPGWAEISKHGIPAAQYQAEFDRIASSGYRPVWIDGYSVNGKAFYNVVFRPVNGTEYVANHGLSGAQYEAEFQKHTKAGFRLTHVDCYEVGNTIQYAAIFSKSPGPAYFAYAGKNPAEHQKEFDKLTKEGFRPTVVSVASSGGRLHHAAIYVKADVGGFWARPAMTQAEFQKEFNDNAKAGRDLVYINAYHHNGQVRFTALWHTLAKSNPAARHGMTAAQYQAEHERHMGLGLLTHAVTGYEANNTHYYAAIWKN